MLMNEDGFTPWPDTEVELYEKNGIWENKNLLTVLLEGMKDRENKVAVVCKEFTLTYGELCQKSLLLANYLKSQGLKPGSTAVVQLPNCSCFLMVFFALLRVGVRAVFPPMSHMKYEWSGYIEQLNPDLIVVSDRHTICLSQKK